MQTRLPKPARGRERIYQEVLSWVNTVSENNALNKWMFGLNGTNQVDENQIGYVSTEYKKLIKISAPVINFPFGNGHKLNRNLKFRVNSSQLRGEQISDALKKLAKLSNLKFENINWMSEFEIIDFDSDQYNCGSFSLNGRGILFIEDIIEDLDANKVIGFNPENKYMFGNFSFDKLCEDPEKKNIKAQKISKEIVCLIKEIQDQERQEFLDNLHGN